MEVEEKVQNANCSQKSHFYSAYLYQGELLKQFWHYLEKYPDVDYDLLQIR